MNLFLHKNSFEFVRTSLFVRFFHIAVFLCLLGMSGLHGVVTDVCHETRRAVPASFFAEANHSCHEPEAAVDAAAGMKTAFHFCCFQVVGILSVMIFVIPDFLRYGQAIFKDVFPLSPGPDIPFRPPISFLNI